MLSEDKIFSVLLVQKDPHAFHLVKKSLEENKRFTSQLDHASGIPEALNKIQQHVYHLLLVEAELDNGTGLELFDRLRQGKMNLPFVLMVPQRSEAIIKEASEHGVTDLIFKSESQFQELSDTLRSYFQKFHQNNQSGKKNSNGLFEVHQNGEAKPDAKAFSIRDELTGLYTHSHLHDRIVEEFSQAARYNYPLSCIMVDMDHFKMINEEYGYKAGEELLKEVATLLFESCRLSDFIARYGGEEFAILLPHIDYKGAQELANRLRVLFAEHIFKLPSAQVNLTISIGVSSFPEDGMKQRGELISYASQALYRSKAAGRNRVTLYKEIIPIFGEEGLPALKISEDKILEFQRRMTEIASIARRGYIDASKALIMALESKDKFTAGHAASVAKYCMQTAEVMGLSLEESEVIQHAGLLHDIGKICIPDTILLKPGRLTITEFETMKQHPYMGYKILKPIKFLQQEALHVLHHHEWFNGEGYPCRLKGSEIPLGARIISVIDSYDTMRASGGRYKKTTTVESTVDELIACSGAQFDPEVVKAFIEVLKARGELKNDNYNKDRLEELLNALPPQPVTKTPL